MREELSLQQKPEDGAAVSFMRILHVVADGSQQRFLRRKDELKALSPVKEPGENVLAYCTKARCICKELEQAHQWDWILVTAILRALTLVSMERFRSVFHPMALAIDAALSAIAYLLSKEDQNEYMIADRKYHYTDILSIAETTYRNILDNDDWGPSKSVKDTQQVPASAFLASMNTDQMSTFLASLNMDSVQFNALVQSTAANQTCHNCLNPGHIARNCKTPVTVTPRAGGTPATTPPSSSTTARGITGWHSVPPTPGDPSTQSKHGRTFTRCTKCNQTKGAWTATHMDATHTVCAQPATASAPTPSPSPSATTPSTGAHLAEAGDSLGIYQF